MAGLFSAPTSNPYTFPMTTFTALIGLGSNIEPRQAHLDKARAALEAAPGVEIVAMSSIRETAPVGPVTDQPAFLNAAIELRTTLSPRVLLELLLDIERMFGRDRNCEQRWGPRTLDLDLLMYADLLTDEPGLIVPHPRLTERRFVLEPLAELGPDRIVPGTAATVAEHLGKLT
jgi:2-amino-4-hydroxy-6-hydroxymethyldihydropteridine diphosphokinase